MVQNYKSLPKPTYPLAIAQIQSTELSARRWRGLALGRNNSLFCWIEWHGIYITNTKELYSCIDILHTTDSTITIQYNTLQLPTVQYNKYNSSALCLMYVHPISLSHQWVWQIIIHNWKGIRSYTEYITIYICLFVRFCLVWAWQRTILAKKLKL